MPPDSLTHNLFLCLIAVPSFKDIVEGIREVLKLVYGGEPPAILLKVIGYLLLVGLAFLGVFGLLFVLSKIKELWTKNFWPLFYNHDKKQRAFDRRKFAKHVERELQRLDAHEEWQDYRFAELEAEVDAEGQKRFFGIAPFWSSRTTLRRERSLSKALRRSNERLVLVEGDPGSGKSVALRHVAQELSTIAARSRSLKTVIPIYVNLKELDRPAKSKLDRGFVKSFILKTLNRVNDRDVDKFLEEEFDQGLKDGTWLFFFDSFDEIPEVLSSTEADSVIEEYADAILDFLAGFNSCRGVTASRYFRGPKQFAWPRFRILPLSQERRLELISKAGLKREVKRALLTQLTSTDQDVWAMSSNPMFLSLLCSHMRDGNPFPETGYGLYESYITSRLTRDEERLKKHFQLKPLEVRATAETVAFCMGADHKLGLSPTRREIKEAATRLQFPLKALDKHLDALEYIKIARSETVVGTPDMHQFTFGHRRFQEYFATCVVLRSPELVTANELLLDARWRETAAVMCQTQPLHVIQSLIGEAETIVEGFLLESFTKQFEDRRLLYSKSVQVRLSHKSAHVFGLLQDGFARRMNLLPARVRESASVLIERVSGLASLGNRKAALEVSGIVPHGALSGLLISAFYSTSLWLRESAFRQVARLSQIPEDISREIQRTLVLLFGLGRLKKDRITIHAHLARLDNGDRYLSSLLLLLWLHRIDLLFIIAALLTNATAFYKYPGVFPNENASQWYFAVSTFMLLGLAFVSKVTFPSIVLLSKDLTTDPASFLFGFRAVLLFFIYLLVIRDKVILPSEGGVAVCLGLWMTWAPSALHAAYSNRSRIRLWSWPILPLLEFSLWIRRSISAFIAATVQLMKGGGGKRRTRKRPSFANRVVSLKRRVDRDSLLKFLKAFVLFVFGVALMVSALFVVGPSAGFLLLLLVVIILGVIPNFIDLVHWHQLRRKGLAQMDSGALMRLLGSYRTDPFRLRLIKYVRVENLLKPTPDTVSEMEQLGLKLEERRSWEPPFNWAGSSHPETNTRLRSRLTYMYRGFLDLLPTPFNRHAEIVDEVYKLIEQLNSRIH